MGKKRQKKDKKKQKKKSKGKITLTAQNANKHELYQRSVQDPEITIDFMNEIYEAKTGQYPLALREDFCGTAYFAAKWVESNAKRTACGVDLDEGTLQWGRENILSKMKTGAERIELLQENVLYAPDNSSFDMVVAFNFSYWVFKTREMLLQYFKNARAGLKDGGVFVVDLHGGPDAQFQMEESTDMGDFEYVWDQDGLCPITHNTTCHIHFRFKDGSEMEKAFTYDWRMWTLPELKDVLADAGFSQQDVWFDEDNGDDAYEICETTENLEAWVGYIAAWK